MERLVDRKEEMKMLLIFRHVMATSVGNGMSKVCMITNDPVHFLGLFLIVCVGIYAPVCSTNRARAHVRSLKLEPQVLVSCQTWVWGTKLCFSERAVGTSNSRGISSAQACTF